MRESRETKGVGASFYGRHKAAVEQILDGVEREHPEIRVVRLRPGLVFKREAATGIRRFFRGPLVPQQLVRPHRVPFVPDGDGLRVQGLHSYDLTDAYRRAIGEDVRGAFNVAADPVLAPPVLPEALVELMDGMSDGADHPTPPLALETTGRRGTGRHSRAWGRRAARSGHPFEGSGSPARGTPIPRLRERRRRGGAGSRSPRPLRSRRSRRGRHRRASR
jgi:hypothetical protein